MPKLTKRVIDALIPREKNYTVWDTEIRGFGARIWPSGKIAYILKYRNKHHRQRKFTIGTHGNITPDRARELAQDYMADVIKGNDPAQMKAHHRNSATIADLCNRFLKEYSSKRHKPSTHDNYRFNIERWILPRIGEMKIDAIQRKDMIELHYEISEHAPQVANRIIAILSKMFNLAEKWELRANNSNPCRHVEKNVAKKKERFLSDAEIAALNRVLEDATLTQTESLSAIHAIRLLLYTGCRLREILDLKWEYVDLKEQCFKLPDSKTGAKRVYFSPLVIETLEKITRVVGNPYVIVGRDEGKQLNNLQKPWRRIRKAAGLHDVRIHDLRHTFASKGIANGLNLPTIGALLGHTQMKTTMRYAHLAGESLKNAAMLVNQKMTEAMQHDRGNHSQIAL
jgi:integrase